MARGQWRIVLVWLAAVAVAETTSAQESTPPTAFEACREETAARLRFIEQRLESGQTYAKLWSHGWLGFYALGVVVSSVQAATTDDHGKRADQAISAVKAVGGTIRQALIRPTARFGADPMQAIPATSQDSCLERLATGEELLRTNAKEARSRYLWRRHFYNFAVNIGGGLIVSEGFGDPKRGLTSAVIGIAIGEVMTWSHPWRGTKDLRDYEREFAPVPMPKGQQVSWELFPQFGGGGVRVRF